MSRLPMSNSAPEGFICSSTPTVIKPQCPVKRLFSDKVLIVRLSVKKAGGLIISGPGESTKDLGSNGDVSRRQVSH